MELSVLLISCFTLLPLLVVHSQLQLPDTRIIFEDDNPEELIEKPDRVVQSQPQLPNIKFENYNPNELSERLPGYGKSWMYFPDGDGKPVIAQMEFNEVVPRFYSPKENFVTFHLYTRLNPNESQIIELGNKSTLIDSNFCSLKPTKFVTHGWKSNYKSEHAQLVKNNFLETDDLNIILVDWDKIASNNIYPITAIETKDVGDYVAQIVDFLVENGANLDNIHMIGHSLGAHIVGRAGHSMKSGKVVRITGLDPALPGFELVAPNENKLDKSDAKFVDVIHTCGGILGYYSKLGHVDFYPNGGVPSQPGCFGVPQIIDACSHGRAWQYFAESIKNKDGFIAIQCDSWDNYKKGDCENNTKIPMGAATPNSVTGVFYLRTNNKPPFVDFDIQALNNTRRSRILKYIPFIG